MCVLSPFSQLFETLWTVAHPGLLCGILQARILEWIVSPFSWGPPDPEIEPVSLSSPALAGKLFTTCATWETRDKPRQCIQKQRHWFAYKGPHVCVSHSLVSDSL